MEWLYFQYGLAIGIIFMMIITIILIHTTAFLMGIVTKKSLVYKIIWAVLFNGVIIAFLVKVLLSDFPIN